MGAAFFGGPIAVTIVAALNSNYLGRLTKEWPLIVGVFLIGVAAAYLFGTYMFDSIEDARSLRFAARAGGFVAFGVVFLIHKKELRALSTLGIAPRSPWGPVGAACLFAVAVHAFLVMTLIEV